jgi:hypothetical protein
LKQIFIQERVKKAPKPKGKRKPFLFFHLDKFQPKEESKGFPAKTKKMDEKSGKPSSVVERLILKGE